MVDMDEDYKVSSELYEEYDYKSPSQPIVDKNDCVSRFTFKYPTSALKVDKDGDLVVCRKSFIEIEHRQSTVLKLVGLQIWRGALLLADWILHFGREFDKNNLILELGAGVGFTSIVAAMYCPVLCTDIDNGGLFQLIKSNVERNKKLINYPVIVEELDFFSEKLPDKICEQLSKVSIIIAADVVYDDLITEAFIKTVQRLLDCKSGPKKFILIALEKRFVFTISDCDSVAPCYEYFKECMGKLKNVNIEYLPLDFPQYFQYDRCKELVLIKISLK